MSAPSIQPGGGAVGQQALRQQAGAGTALTGMGSKLFGMGAGNLQQAGGFFSKLAAGNRGVATQALAPDIENIKDVYGGTARSLSRFLRGPEKDVQLAEASREKAGAVSSLFRNVRPQANAALASMGAGEAGAGTGATGAGGSLFGGVAQTSQQAAEESAKLAQQHWQGIGSLFASILSPIKLFGGGGG